VGISLCTWENLLGRGEGCHQYCDTRGYYGRRGKDGLSANVTKIERGYVESESEYSPIKFGNWRHNWKKVDLYIPRKGDAGFFC